MDFHNQAPFRLFLFVLGMVMFALAASLWWAIPDSPHRVRLIAAGLFFCAASTFF